MNFKLAKLHCSSLQEQWFIYYYFKHPETGKMVRFREYISNSIKTKSGRLIEGQKKLTEINHKLKRGWNPFEKEIRTVTRLIDALEIAVKIKVQSTSKTRTRQTYRDMYLIFERFCILNKYQHIPVDNFYKKNALEFMDYCLLTKKYSPCTYNHILANMRSFFKHLINREYITFNPFADIAYLTQPEPEIVAFSKKELEIIQTKLPEYNYDLYAIAHLIFHTYIRVIEITKLKVKDINFENKTITIRPEVGKNKKQKVLGMHDQLFEILQQLRLEHYPLEYFIFSKNLKPGIFQINPNRIHEHWKKFCAFSGVKKTIYKLKHTGAGMSAEKGVNLRDLQLQLRHYSLEMTQIYLDKFKQSVSHDNLKNFASM